MKSCLACRLNKNPNLIPGGRIAETENWIVEHCIGSYGIGTLVIKTKQHKEQFSQCSKAELEEFAILLLKTHQAIEAICKPERIYLAKWGEETKHLHILIQPIHQETKKQFKAKGPILQSKMMEKGEKPNWEDAEKIAIALKNWMKENS